MAVGNNASSHSFGKRHIPQLYSIFFSQESVECNDLSREAGLPAIDAISNIYAALRQKFITKIPE